MLKYLYNKLIYIVKIKIINNKCIYKNIYTNTFFFFFFFFSFFFLKKKKIIEIYIYFYF